jgi:hypothetical protein
MEYTQYLIIIVVLIIIALAIAKSKKKDFKIEVNKLVDYLGGKNNILNYEVNKSRFIVTLHNVEIVNKEAIQKMGIPNFKISSKDHVWNYVYLDNKWYHLDLTWDDPIVNTNEPMLVHNYFLITTKELEKEPNDQHIYSKDVYSEAK